MIERDSLRSLAIAGVVLTVIAAVTVLAGCESSSARGPGTADVGCEIPSACDDYSAANERELHLELLDLFDKMEMASGGGHESRIIPVVQQMEVMLQQCPRLVLPRLIEQMNRPVHELQRANIAMVLGWYAPGRDCTAPHLRAMLADPIPLVRYQAAAALVDLRDESGLPLLVDDALQHSNPTVRGRALEALSGFAGRRLTSPEDARAWYASR